MARPRLTIGGLLRSRVARVVCGLSLALALGELAARAVEPSLEQPLRWYDEATELKVQQMDDVGPVDVVFAGTSMSWQGFDPAIFVGAEGATSGYNAGLAGGVPQVMEPWLTSEVVPRLRPKRVVWGLSSLDFSPSYGHENHDLYTQALESRSGVLADFERSGSRLLALVRNRGAVRDPSAGFGLEAEALRDRRLAAQAITGEQGQRLDFATDVSDQRRAVQRSRLAAFSQVDPNDVRSIVRTIEQLREQGIEVVLVEMPVPDRFVDLHPAGSASHDLVAATIELIAIDQDVAFVDLSSGFDDSNFVDFTHLDQPSATRLTLELAAALGVAPGEA